MVIVTADYHSVIVSDTYLNVVFSVIKIFGYNVSQNSLRTCFMPDVSSHSPW